MHVLIMRVCVCLRICCTMQDPQSEADNRPMLAEDALSREVARDVVVHDHVQEAEELLLVLLVVMAVAQR